MYRLLFIVLNFIVMTPLAQTIPLYPDKIPNSIERPDEEKVNTENKPRYTHVSRPTLTIYLPPKYKANGTAVVICPGGGYGAIAYQHEGNDVAEALSKEGITAFVLKYRLPADKIMKDKSIGPLQDAQQAMKVVRERSMEWGINPEKIGIMGFSAGGHLASTAGTHFNTVQIENKEGTSVRPDFMILIYPVISFQDSLAHPGSRNALIGKAASADVINLYSNELQVTNQTPPTFLVHAEDDKTVKVQNTIRFYEALKKNNVPAELLIFPKGNHGFGLINPTTSDRWLERCKDWMRSNGLL